MPKSKTLSPEDELNALPDAAPEAQFDALPTATGQASLNKPTGPSMGDRLLNAVPGGPLIKPLLPGASGAMEEGAKRLPEALRSGAEAFVSPENLAPMAASVAVSAAGQPELSPAAAAAASFGVETMKGVKPPESIAELLTTASLNAIPGAGGAAIGSQVSPETGAKAIGQSALQAGFEALPFAGSGALKKNVMPEIKATYGELGVKPALNQVTRESGLAKFLDFASGGIFATAEKEAKQAANLKIISQAQRGLAKDFTDEITATLTPEQIGNSLREGIDDIGIKAQKAVEDALYKRLDDLTGGERVTVYEAPRAPITDRGYISYKKRTMEMQTDPLTGQPIPIEESIKSGKIPVTSAGEPVDPLTLQPVERRIGGLEVPTTDIKRFVQSLSKTAKSESAVRLVNNVMDEARTLPFNEMKALRSDLMNIARTQNDPSLTGLAKGLTGVVDKSMTDTAKAAGDDVYNLWRSANEVTKTGYDTLKTDLTARLILNDTRNAEAVGEGIARKGDVTPIREVKRAIQRAEQLTTEPEYKALIAEAAKNNPEKYGELLDKKVVSKNLMDNVKAGYYNDLMNRFRQTHPDYPEETFVRFGPLQKYLADADTQDTMRELFSPEEMNRLQRLTNAGAKMEAKNAGASVIISRIFGTLGEGALGIGSFMSKVVQHPETIKYLTEGMEKMSVGSRVATQQGVSTALRAIHYLLTKQTVSEMENIDAK